MKIYKTQEEVTADIKDGVLVINGDVRFECDISIRASIVVTKGNLTCWDLTCFDLTCWDLNCWNLTCRDLTCEDLTCEDLKCRNLNCRNLDCWNLTCRDLTCRNLKCLNLECWNITCRDLSYYALCFAYHSIKCTSYKARREVHQKPMCLDGEITISK